jgi:tetratricopeptide (TPR) repeat protein
VLGLIYSTTGRLGLAIAEHEKADSLDPLNDQNILNLVQVLWWAGRLNLALAAVERSIALRPDAFIPQHGLRAQILLALGRKTEAVAEARFVRDHPDLSPRLQSDSVCVRVLLQAGFKDEASAYAAQLFARWAPDHYQRGFVLTALGRFDEAIPYLERTVAQPVRFLFWDESFDPYRNDPRFLQLLTKLGRAEHYQVARETRARLGKP